MIDKPFTQWTGADFVAFAKTVDKKTWIKVGVAAVVLGLLGYFVVHPAWFKRAVLKQQIAGIEGNIIRLQTLKRNEKQWRQDKADYLDYIQSVKQRLYLPGETALLLGKVSKLAELSGVSIVSSSPQAFSGVTFPAPFNEKYKPELYDFTVEGGYHQLGDFISRIEANPKILRVEIFEISPIDESPDRHLANMTLSAVSLLQGREA